MASFLQPELIEVAVFSDVIVNILRTLHYIHFCSLIELVELEQESLL